MGARITFNRGPEMTSMSGRELTTAHHTWTLAEMFDVSKREGHALSAALGTLGIDRAKISESEQLFTGSTKEMLARQRAFSINVGKIAHEAGREAPGNTSVHYIAEALYRVASQDESFLDPTTDSPLSFNRAIGALALPFADMVYDEAVYTYFDTNPLALRISKPITTEHAA